MCCKWSGHPSDEVDNDEDDDRSRWCCKSVPRDLFSLSRQTDIINLLFVLLQPPLHCSAAVFTSFHA